MCTSTICRLRLPRFIRLQEILNGANQIHSFAGVQSGTTGTGGELHQQPTNGGALLTTNQGVVIADNQNSFKAAPRGPTLLEDFILRRMKSSSKVGPRGAALSEF